MTRDRRRAERFWSEWLTGEATDAAAIGLLMRIQQEVRAEERDRAVAIVEVLRRKLEEP